MGCLPVSKKELGKTARKKEKREQAPALHTQSSTGISIAQIIGLSRAILGFLTLQSGDFASEINYKLGRLFSRTPRLGNNSVLGNGRINLVGPGENAAFQVEDFAEARLAQEVDGFGGTRSATAIRHNFA